LVHDGVGGGQDDGDVVSWESPWEKSVEKPGEKKVGRGQPGAATAAQL